MWKRQLQLSALLARKSFFLFGPKGVGKTRMIAEQLPHAQVFDLSDAQTCVRVMQQPSLLLETNDPLQVVVLEEVQHLPALLNDVQGFIEGHARRFLLTASQPRKLLHGRVNRLKGHAWSAELFGLSWSELPSFDLNTYLNTGGLPAIYGQSNAQAQLQRYVADYLQDVQVHALTRNLPAYATFLDAIAHANGRELNYEALATVCNVAATTVKSYVDVLTESGFGYCLPGFTKTKKRRAIARAKHYLCDVGVANVMAHRGNVLPQSSLFAEAFEHFIIGEVRTYLSYVRRTHAMTYWRSTSNFTVALLIGDALAVDICASKIVHDRQLKGLRALHEEDALLRHVMVCLETTRRTTDDGLELWPWAEFLRELWAGNVV